MSTLEAPTESQISNAVGLLRQSQEKDDHSLFVDLVRIGLSRQLAARLVEFLPMAYCRVMLQGSGIQFSNSYRRAAQTGILDAEPIWSAAYNFAGNEVRRGISRSDLLAIAGRSAEFQAINELLNKGSKLSDVKLTAPFLAWPEAGPDD
jgi:hypothetical protein